MFYDKIENWLQKECIAIAFENTLSSRAILNFFLTKMNTPFKEMIQVE